jgi:phospholipase C
MRCGAAYRRCGLRPAKETRIVNRLRLLPMVLFAAVVMGGRHSSASPYSVTQAAGDANPIQHLVVLYQENASFDHYFATYPLAANPPGEPTFLATPGTPSVNGLTDTLLAHNPNASAPFRLDRTQAYTCDQDHAYSAEQKAYNGGLVDRFVENTEGTPADAQQYCHTDATGRYDAVLGYFDGNTVTALWNYAQHFAISDNSFDTTFGQSTAGALHLAAADVDGAVCGDPKMIYGGVPACLAAGSEPPSSATVPAPANGQSGTLYADTDPYWDVCSTKASYPIPAAAFSGRNIGSLLTDAGVSWGWFQGGFALANDGACYATSHVRAAYDRAAGIDPATDTNAIQDYVPHHNPFQYVASTANPSHMPPSSPAMVGHTDQANHLYDLSWFWQAAEAGSLPTVSFLKAPQYQNGHPGISDPLDEQQYLVETLNRLQRLPEWQSTAVIIAWDDSDGWYDHVMPPIINHSNTALDSGCGPATMGAPVRCGYGPRLPLLVISPFARPNAVSHRLTDQSSITRFIEDTWLGSERISPTSFDNLAGSLSDLFDPAQAPLPPLYLDPATGLVTASP